ncbi:MAG: hypothetical protein M3384_12330 [Acidobacteriota bacterium]|nr:hypothetical protein [Acidobacteriota bacterium]
MKPSRIFFALLILFFSFQVCRAQEKSKIELFDYFGDILCEEILARLDNFFAAVGNEEPGTIGYVVFYGGANHIQNHGYRRAIANYRRFRRFDENRFKLITANPLPEFKIELWLGRNGAKPAVAEIAPDLILNRITERYLFAEDSVEVVKIDGRRTSLIFGCDCCINTADLGLLSKYLEANPGMRADVRVYSKTRNYANQFITLFLKEAKEEYKIPLHRLKIGYAGVDKGIAQLPGKLSTVKIWLVPLQKGRKR